MSQTVHNTAPAVATEGQIIDGREVISAVVDSTNGVIPFGRALRFKTMPAPGQLPVVELPDATGEITGDTFAGISVFDPTRELAVGVMDFAGFVTGDVISLLRRGKIWVITQNAVAAYQPAFARFVAPLGVFRADVDTANAVAVPGSRYLTTGGTAGLIELELDVQD